MRQPSLAIFLPSLAGGGAERMMLNLARGMVESGVTLDLVLGQASGPYRDLVPVGCELVDLRAGRVLTALPGLAGYLRQCRPTVLLTAMDHANLIALSASALARVPTRVYVSVRSTLSQECAHAGSRIHRWLPHLARLLYPRAAAVIAVSQGVAEDLERVLGTGRIQPVVIPNPVVTPDLQALAAALPDHPWLADGAPPVILGAGRLTHQKDFPTLIRAFAAIDPARGLRLMILGEGPQRGALESLVRELGLSERIALPGFSPNPFAAMARARLFVLSSAWEGLPGVLIQAMACGTPVVSTDCPSGPREILSDGRYGPLVPIGDAAALAVAIAAALEQPIARERLMSRAADYRLEPVTRRYLEVMGLDPTGASARPA
ncbi:MAG: glycosyltransferase [Sphingobacteriia bacterium]|nr:glycosyltransferase [Sphingobacteriia bacterium]NCC40393.1 glycosyltransferase [Gammaproteobacteria bacterium]